MFEAFHKVPPSPICIGTYSRCRRKAILKDENETFNFAVPPKVKKVSPLQKDLHSFTQRVFSAILANADPKEANYFIPLKTPPERYSKTRSNQGSVL